MIIKVFVKCKILFMETILSARARPHTRAHAHARTLTHARTHARTHTHTRTRARMHTYTRMHARTHTHTEAPAHTSMLTIQSFIFVHTKRAANRGLRQMKTAARYGKHGS